VRRALVALLAAGATACGGGSRAGRSSAETAVTRAQATHEYPSPAPPHQSAAGRSATPPQAIDSFARAYINWTADTVSRDMRKLAARSIGQARSAV